MKISKTIALVRKKILIVFGYLIFVRLLLYIPVPSLDLDLFTQIKEEKSLFAYVKNLNGSNFLGIGALGIVPYINASIILQLITPIIPELGRLQKEEGALGRQKLNRYTKYLAFVWAIVVSTAITLKLIKPLVFSWNLSLALKIIFSLTIGSMLSIWFAELITAQNLGNGYSMVLFMNVIGGVPSKMSNIKNSYLFLINNFGTYFLNCGIYFFTVWIIIFVQGSYKKIKILSARQLNSNYLERDSLSSRLTSSYIPLRLNQGGALPLVFSSTISKFLLTPVEVFIEIFFPNRIESLLTFISLILNGVLILYCSIFYALFVLKPKDLSDNLTKTAYKVPGIRQGKETKQYLEKIIIRLAFISGIFLVFISFSPLFWEAFLKVTFFKDYTSLIFLVGVVADVTSQLKVSLLSKNYEK